MATAARRSVAGARGAAGALAIAIVLASGALVSANNPPAVYRIFLRDGAALVSYGEYARVADRVVFSMPIGGLDESSLQLVSIVESAVDWARTEQYTAAVRAKRYAETRGPEDFARLANRITEALNDIRATPDPARRLAMAEEARRNLARWPSDNFGYKGEEVTQLLGMLDEVIAELRMGAGQPGFDLSLIATTLPEPPMPLLAQPDERELFEQAVSAARATPDSGERVSLMQSIAAALNARPREWSAALSARLKRELAAELRIDRAYQDLTTRMTAAASVRARRADVRGIEALSRTVLESDGRLGRRRPQEIAALLRFLDLRLDEARRLRLAMDAFAMRSAIFAQYRKAVTPHLDELRQARVWLDDIRRLAGPAPGSLGRYEQRVVMARRGFDAVAAPTEFEGARGMLISAFHMAQRAAATRRNAVSSNNISLAWDASSAAAGALMLLEQAEQEFERLLTPANR